VPRRSTRVRWTLPQSTTRRGTSAKGNARARDASMRLKIAVFAPMPMASAATATIVKPGAFRSVRSA
jgi:hypothetical protein